MFINRFGLTGGIGAACLDLRGTVRRQIPLDRIAMHATLVPFRVTGVMFDVHSGEGAATSAAAASSDAGRRAKGRRRPMK